MLTCSWSGSTAPGANRISAVIRPVERSNSSVLASQPGKRVFCHSIPAGRTRWECVSAVCALFGVTASMVLLRSIGLRWLVWGFRDQVFHNKAFGALPGFIGVAAEGDEPVKPELVFRDVDDLNFGVLNERAHLLNAAIEQAVGAGDACLFGQIRRRQFARCAARLRTGQRDDPVTPGTVEVGANSVCKGLQPRPVLGLLVGRLARGVEIIEIADR